MQTWQSKLKGSRKGTLIKGSMEGSLGPRFIVYPTFQLGLKLYLYIYMIGLLMSSRPLLTTSPTATHPLTMSQKTKDHTRLPPIFKGIPSMVSRLPLPTDSVTVEWHTTSRDARPAAPRDFSVHVGLVDRESPAPANDSIDPLHFLISDAIDVVRKTWYLRGGPGIGTAAYQSRLEIDGADATSSVHEKSRTTIRLEKA